MIKQPTDSVHNLRVFVAMLSHYHSMKDSMDMYHNIIGKCVQEQHVSEESEQLFRRWFNKTTSLNDRLISGFDSNIKQSREDLMGDGK